jgi:hypothetical protein
MNLHLSSPRLRSTAELTAGVIRSSIKASRLQALSRRGFGRATRHSGACSLVVQLTCHALLVDVLLELNAAGNRVSGTITLREDGLMRESTSKPTLA